MRTDQTRRVVVTGLGVIAPNGIGTQNFWRATQQGISGITPLAHTTDVQDTIH